MNKLILAVSTVVLVSSINIATAQQAGTGTGTNGALDNGHPTGAAAATTATDTMNPEHRPNTGTASGMNMEHEKTPMHKGKMAMKDMDTNHDGMVSKEEFMTYHEAMYDHMTKNKEGMVDMKTMQMMHRSKDK